MFLQLFGLVFSLNFLDEFSDVLNCYQFFPKTS